MIIIIISQQVLPILSITIVSPMYLICFISFCTAGNNPLSSWLRKLLQLTVARRDEAFVYILQCSGASFQNCS